MVDMSTTRPSLDNAYVYNAEVVRVVDGDTVRMKLWKSFNFSADFGFYIKEEVSSIKSTEMNFRLLGIDAPETRGAPEEERIRGTATMVELTRLLGLGPLIARTSKPDKYGRWLVEIWVLLADGGEIFVNSKLIDGGFAVPYMV